MLIKGSAIFYGIGKGAGVDAASTLAAGGKELGREFGQNAAEKLASALWWCAFAAVVIAIAPLMIEVLREWAKG